MKLGIGIIGNGFVGDAVAHGFSKINVTPYIYDLDRERCEVNFQRAAEQQFVFICVPTPVDDKGQMNFSMLDSVMSTLEKTAQEIKRDIGTVVIKSTVLPGIVEKYTQQYPFRIISNPEFLTQRTAREDFIQAKRVILGTDERSSGIHATALWGLYRALNPSAKIIQTSHNEAALIKCACNSFYAVKLSFMNELYQACKVLGADYSYVLDGILSSGWVNPMHTQVPGPDGKPGFGGKCLPKDISAFATCLSELGIIPMTMRGAIATNMAIREDVYERSGDEGTSELLHGSQGRHLDDPN